MTVNALFASEDRAAARRELIAFRIGEQEFCLDVMAVREIRGFTPATPLPQAPDYVRGVINLRGAVLPIVDLAVRLGLPAPEVGERHVIIVARIGTQLVGLLVDAVSDILTIDDEVVQATPDVASEHVKSFVKGLIAIDGRMIGLVQLDRVLPQIELEAA